MNKVCGLLLSPDFAEVVLIQTPEGLSGIEGPSSKDDRRVRDTMSRVGKERCGLEIKPEDWTLFAEFLKPDKTDGERTVYFFHNTHQYREADGDGVQFYRIDPDDFTDPDSIYFRDQLEPRRLWWLIQLATEWNSQELDIVLMFHTSARGRPKAQP